MTTTTMRSSPAQRLSIRPIAHPVLWHQRLSGSWWSRITTAATVAVFIAATIAAVVYSLHAPSVSPVTLGTAVPGTTAPAGVLDFVGNLFGGTDTGRGGTGRGGRR